MDNLIQELSDIIKLPFNEINKDFKLIMLSNKMIYVSNYIKILDYSTEKLVLKVHKDFIEIKGENLFISQINKHEIIIKGTILSYCLGVGNEKRTNKS